MDWHDYDGCTKVFSRPSARAIILQHDAIALVYSNKEKYYKFPGGGIHPGEDKKAALSREVKEEAGMTVIPESIAEFGSVMRRQKSNMEPNTVFEQENFYYVCRVEDTLAEQKLDDYEREAEFTLQWTDIDEAIRVNDEYDSENFFNRIMIKREMRVLQIIREAMITQALLPYGCVMRFFPDANGIYVDEYSGALDGLAAKHSDNRFLSGLEAISGAKESADAILAENGYPVVSPEDFGRVFIKLLRYVYEGMEISAFANKAYELWESLPDGIKNDEPFLTLNFAGDPLLSCGDETRTRQLCDKMFAYYD
jgi:NTP pyrophosphohydrolases including oxidative damage repair enzymes